MQWLLWDLTVELQSLTAGLLELQESREGQRLAGWWCRLHGMHLSMHSLLPAQPSAILALSCCGAFLPWDLDMQVRVVIGVGIGVCPAMCGTGPSLVGTPHEADQPLGCLTCQP